MAKTAAAAGYERRFFYGYIVLIAGFFILLIMNGALYSFGVFLKPLSAEFGWSRAETSGAYSVFMFLCGFLYTVAGRLTDTRGPRFVLTIAGLTAGMGYMLMYTIGSIWQMYLFFGVFAAAGHSGGLVPLTSTLARWFVKRRGLMTGLLVAGIGIGTIVMPPVATRLIESIGWRGSYLVIGVVALVIVITAARFLRADPARVGQFPDGGKGTSSGAAAGLTLREAMRTRQFWMFCTLALFHGVGQQAVMVHIAPAASDLGVPAISAAAVVSVVGGLSIAGRIGLGGAADRIGTRSSLAIALALCTIALFFVLGAAELWMFYLFAVIFGLGYGAIMALLSPSAAALTAFTTSSISLMVL